MSDRLSWILRITHILDAIERIELYINGISEDEFYEDIKTFQAVERNFEIIGGAAKHVPQEIIEKYPDIEWLGMRSMRNFIAHQYDDLEEHVLWQTIIIDLPPLKANLKDLLEREFK